MDYAKESLRLHAQWRGKIEIKAVPPVKTKEDLSLAYTPGVAAPCLEIQKDINKSYELTRRHNLCAVITDGSAVLPYHVGKLPYIADSHGTARTDQQKAQAGFKRLSFHVVLLFQSSFIL